MPETKISAGSYDLNKWLYGGYERDVITTIYGPGGSGKTNFCMMVAVSQAKKDNKVIYVDTEGGFSVDRFKQILGGEEKEKLDKYLENVLLFSPVVFEEQKKIFSKILDEVRVNSNIGTIIVDSIAMLYRLALSEAKGEIAKVKEVNSELARQLRILSEIARKKNIPVIVTNQVYSDFLSREELEMGKERGVNMVGGDLLKYWSKCIIELENKNGKRRAILRKHRSLSERDWSFVINESGARKKGWI